MNSIVGLSAVFLLTLATGYFVAQEFAYVAADRSALKEQAAAGDAAADRALRVTSRLSFMLSGAQLGITVTTLLVGFVTEPALTPLISPVLTAAGVPEAAIRGLSVALGLVIATTVQMVLGELAPKNLGIARPEVLAKWLSRSTLAYLAVAGPVIRLFDAAATRLLRRVGVEPVEEIEHGATPEELSRIIAESEASGDLSQRLSDLLERALEFGDRTAEDVMVPRPRVVSLRAGRPASDLLDAVRTAGHSQYPVLGPDGDVVGVTGLREWIGAPSHDVPIERISTAPLLVPTSLPLPELRERMRVAGGGPACVIDEYGGLAGLVTMEDLAEELVGELMDENDPDAAAAVEQGDGTWDVPGTLRLDEVERATGLRLPESEDYETVAGLVMARLGRLAEPGDEMTVPLVPDNHLLEDDGDGPGDADVVLTVLEVQRRVPARVRLTRRVADPAVTGGETR
ncbi:hemolysin family protein [Sphaerisporangium rubeum]|uniref:CBS domain containing-hemolysin-like protein n=1 Tax=Sphaerisporangium rubeum TaxID=321317 RepID=A0A7X0IKQ0_9ACTN|nr:hemolysin family protein [Sphaerisporangium rubeum]MBB6476941.1 CBS domain containing-hemolysin-like protein [Sphaerisporangium rubeum]